jgi:hypothetical protein
VTRKVFYQGLKAFKGCQHLIFGFKQIDPYLPAKIIYKRDKVSHSRDARMFEWAAHISVDELKCPGSLGVTLGKFLSSLFP